MKKLIIILALLLGANCHADAQFLKKLGNAIDKATKTVDNVANTILGDSNMNKSQSKKEKRVGKPVQIGNTTIECYGDNPGMGFNWIGAERRYGGYTVHVSFQLENQTYQEMHVEMSSMQGNPSYLLDLDGNKYNCGSYNLDNFTAENAWVTIAEDSKVQGHIYVGDVPSNVKELQLVYLGFHVNRNKCSYRLKNVPIKLLPAITNKGIFGASQIKLGDKITTLPKTFEGLYDSYVVEDINDEDSDFEKVVNFYLKGKEMFTGFSYNGTTIEYIVVTTPLVATKIHGKFYRCGENVSGLRYKGGFTEGIYGELIYNDVSFDEDEEGKVCAIRIGDIPIE